MNFLNCGVNELTNTTEDESFYGQWPCYGEIDIMEVVGSDTSKAFGTVHYGSPHAESQGIRKSVGYAEYFAWCCLRKKDFKTTQRRYRQCKSRSC